MDKKRIDEIFESQKEFFKSGATLPVKFRVEMLKKLYLAIKENEKEIMHALKVDLGKSDYEAFMSEIGLVLTEISYMIKNTKKFAKEKTVKTPLSQFASRSYIKPSPFGNTLIISPWNYPVLLSIDPLVDAISAGNTAIIKPSEFSQATSQVIEKIISKTFPSNYVAVVNGAIEECTYLLKKKFDFVFFTGSQAVGKEVLKYTAESLTPAVLELGGKSPCIVDDTAKIELTAKRIVFGKFLNCGQTCVAPDYILCDKKIKDELVKEIIFQIKTQYGENPLNNADYGKIISERHFDRISKLVDKKKTVFGGDVNKETLQISPTVLDNVTWEDEIMQTEIFGPILPILTYENFDEIYSVLQDKQKPLALYFFSQDKKRIKEVTERCAYGGGCINDTIIHLATSELGFGGVGESGMGAYHGKAGFEAFSYNKGIVNKRTWIDLPMRYQPYDRGLFAKLLRLFLR